MNAGYQQIMKQLRERKYAPVYVIDGEEPFYLDNITTHFENDILPPAERDFNLLILYGREATYNDVVNACMRFPMFAERQVVIVKDAAQLKDLNDLSHYIEKPMPTTVLLVEHRFKKVDGKTKLAKVAKDKAVYFTSEKIKDDDVPEWIMGYGAAIDFQVQREEAQILTSYLGNDLQKIANEIDKIRINVPEQRALTAALIKKYIGISREYNLFELPAMLTGGHYDKLYNMLAYFFANAKSAPMPLITGTFYYHFNMLYKANFAKGMPDKSLPGILGTYPGRVHQLMAETRRWNRQKVEECLLLVAAYNARGVGIGSVADDTELLKEMIGRMVAIAEA
jgi:DNA polymerase III subunit delta